MPFDVTLSGDEAYRRKLAQLELHLADLRNFWPMLVPLVHSWTRDQFDSEGGWGGEHWQELSPDYAAWKSVHYPGKSILIRTGGLRHAASDMRRAVTPRTLTMWIDDPVASFHQDGTDRMPARPLIPNPLPSSARVEVDLAAVEYVSTLVRRIGL